jgi:hypothetical protein
MASRKLATATMKELAALGEERSALVDRLLSIDEQLEALERSFVAETAVGGSALSDWSGYLSAGHSVVASRSSGSSGGRSSRGTKRKGRADEELMLFSWSSAATPSRSGRYPAF